MNLPKCNNYGHQFSWRRVHKSLFKFNVELNCPNCDSKLFPTAKSRKKVSYYTFFIVLIGPASRLMGVPLKISILIMGIIGLAYLIFLPFLYSFIDREESLC